MKVLVQPATPWQPRQSVAIGPHGGVGRPAGIRVLVVDDRDLVHLGYRLLFTSQKWVERCVVARDYEQAVEFAGRYKPQVVILDLGVANGSGLRIAQAVLEAASHARLVIAGAGCIPTSRAQRLGCSAVLPDRARAEDILRIVHGVASGDRYLPMAPSTTSGLSRREREVLALLGNGGTNREIAAALHLAPDTVKQHAAAIYRKLGVRNRTEAARKADELGLLTMTSPPSAASDALSVASA